MSEKTISRRVFLKSATVMAAAAVLGACSPASTAAPTKPAAPAATSEPTKPAAPAATSEPTKPAAPAATTAPTKPPSPYKEAPMLEALVKAGKLPPVEQRVSAQPYVTKPTEIMGWKGKIGKYGGSWRFVTKGPGDGGFWTRIVWVPKLIMWGADYANGVLLPGFAQSWSISPDGRSFTFTLRKGMKWSDGEPFTTKDIQWWWDNYYLNKDLGSFINYWITLRQGDALAELKVADDVTFSFTFKDPNGLLLWNLAVPEGDLFIKPSHYLKQFHKDFADPKTLDELVKKAGFDSWVKLFHYQNDNWEMNMKRPNLYPWMITNPVGAGTQVIWERNPYFWMVDEQGQQLPYIDKLVATVHQTVDTMVLAAIAGEVDCQARHVFSVANMPMLTQNQQKGGYHLTDYSAADGPTDVPYCLSLTTKDAVKRELFRNKNFRLALSHAVNRKALWDLVFKGAVSLDGPKWGSPLQQDEVDKIYKDAAVYDVKQADKMLDDLGLTKRDGDGYRLMKDGKRLSILIEHATAFPTSIQVSEIVAQDWKKVGVEAIVKTYDRTLLTTKRQNDECELAVPADPGRGAPWTIDGMVTPTFDAPMLWEAEYGHKWFTWYSTGGKDPNGEEPPEDVKKSLALFDEMKRTTDFKKQVELFKQMRMIRAQGFWWINLGPYWASAVSSSVTKNDMQNVPPKMPDSWNWGTPGASQTWMYYFDPPRSS